jgi:hypothetical protein
MNSRLTGHLAFVVFTAVLSSFQFGWNLAGIYCVLIFSCIY